MSQEQRTLLIRSMGAFAVVLVIMLAVGTFADYQIAQTIYAPDNPLVVFISTLGLIPLAYLGCLFLGVLAQRCHVSRKSPALRIAGVVLCVVLVASYVVVEIVKNFMARPRPRVLLAGYEGIDFCPWYQKSSGAEGFMAAFGLEKDAFKSFPSGHSVQAAAFLLSFYGLSLVYPGLRDKLGIALVVEIVFALTVMACRMILGAHFLTDVSVGALVSVAAFLVMLALQERLSRRP